MSLKKGPSPHKFEPIHYVLVEELKNGKPGAEDRLYKHLIEDTKRTGTFYTSWYFESLGLEYPNVYSVAIDEYNKQKAMEYAEKKKIEEQKRKEKMDKITKLLMGTTILILLVVLVIVCIYK